MSNRRSFLKQAGIVAAAAFVGPSTLSSALATEKAKFSKVGLQLYTLRDQLAKDAKGTISAVAKAGYKQVETFYRGTQSATEPGFWGLNAKEFLAFIASEGLSSPSGHYIINPFLVKGGSDEILKRHIETAATVGQTYLTVPVPPPDLMKAATADNYLAMAEKLNIAGELCMKSGLKLAYHNHNFEFTKLGDGTAPYDILLDKTDPALVSFELDLFWAVNAGRNPVKMFTQHPGRFRMWHVKDMDKTDNKVFTEVGTGRIDFANIFKAAKTAGTEYIFVEQDVIKGDPIQSISKSINYINDSLLS